MSGEREVSVQVLFDGRNYQELEQALGCFATPIPISLQVSLDQPFNALIEQVDTIVRDAEKWQETFDWREAGGASANTLSTSSLAFEAVEVPEPFRLGTLDFAIEHLHLLADLPKLCLQLRSRAHQHHLLWRFPADRFTPAAGELLAESFLALLSHGLRSPATPIARLALLSPARSQQILALWNATETALPPTRCLHHLFAEQAARSPNAIAVRAGSSSLSFALLDILANRLAHQLLALGLRPDLPVGLCLSRSPDVLVALLAILKAGGAYLPLDPSLPPARLAAQLATAGVRLILTQPDLHSHLAQLPAQLLCLEPLDPAAAPCPPPDSRVQPANLAYILFTSGSTGTPKGVAVPHQAVVNYLCWAAQAYQLAEGHGSLVHSPLGFDLTLTSLLAPLLVGQTVELLPEGQEVLLLGQALERARELSLLKLTPAHLRLLADWSSEQARARAARVLVVGGEALRHEHIAPWLAAGTTTRIVNEYGPTEATVGCCVYEVSTADLAAGTCRSDGRSRICSCMCWMRAASRFQWEWRASCTSAASGWRAAMSGSPA